METTLLFSFPNDIFPAISGWLLHSLWAGLLLALLVSVVMIATKDAPARRRYNLLLACLAVFALLMVIILAVQLSSVAATGSSVAAMGAVNHDLYVLSPAHPSSPGLLLQLLNLVEQYSPAIVLAWMIVVLVRSIRLAGGLYKIRELRLKDNEPVSSEWQQRLMMLATRIGVKKNIRLLRSHRVRVPLVIGHFKPLILLPFSLVSSIPPAQVEAILLHELAHISRRDYLVNLLVSLLETIFFFNPAVVWVSSLIRKERENCCDDITVGLVSDPRDYIEALLWCQQEQGQVPALAAALLDKPRYLLGRVRRMIYKHNNRSLNNMEKSIVSFSLVLAGLFALAFTAKTDNSLSITETKQVVTKCPENSSVFQKDYWNRTYPQRDTVPPAPPVAPAGPSVRTGTPPAPATSAPPPATGKTPLAPLSAPATPTPPPATGRTPLAPLRAPAAPLSTTAVPAEPTAAPFNNFKTAAPEPARPFKETLEVPIPLPVPVTHIVSINIPGNPADHYFPPAKTPGAQETNRQREKILDEMVSDGIIKKDFSSLSFKLSTTEFIVNGKKQPAVIFEKYRKSYVNHTGQGSWSWYYNYDTSSSEN